LKQNNQPIHKCNEIDKTATLIDCWKENFKWQQNKAKILTSKVLFHNILHGISMILKEVQKLTNVVTLHDTYDFFSMYHSVLIVARAMNTMFI